MSAIDLPKEQDLVEYRVDRILEEANTDTRIVVLARQDGGPDTFPIWVGAAEGNAIKLALDYATLHVSNKGVERTIDARPSDAISLALRAPCPIYITQDVLKRRSTSNLDAWLAKLESKDIGTPEVQET